MSNSKTEILFPTGRLVQGNLYKAQDKDADGKPLTIKSGPNAGKPTVKYYFAVAVTKTPGKGHWANEEWGAKIWAIGHATWPGGQAQAPSFAWKVDDGDSTIANKKGRTNASREGFPGCWIVNFSSQFSPKIYNSNGTVPMPEPDAVKTGHYVQVLGTVDSNESSLNPGLFINHSLVAFQGFGPEIYTGPDPTKVGFGQGAMPPGMSAAPIGGLSAPAAPAVPGAAPAPAPYAAPPPAAAAPPPAAAPAPMAVVPAPSFVGVQAAPPPPGAAPAPPPAAVKPPHKGVPYASYIAAKWTDAQLAADGYAG